MASPPPPPNRPMCLCVARLHNQPLGFFAVVGTFHSPLSSGFVYIFLGISSLVGQYLWRVVVKLIPWSRVLLLVYSCFSRKISVHYRVYKSLPPVPALPQTNIIHTLPSYFLNLFFNIISISASSSPRNLLPLSFLQKYLCIVSPIRAIYPAYIFLFISVSIIP